MAFQWSLTQHDNCYVFSLTGDLAESDAAHMASAVAWVSARCATPITVDLEHLWRFRDGGETLLGECIAGLTPPGVILCLPENGLPAITDQRVLRPPRIHRLSEAQPALRHLETRIASTPRHDP